VLGAPSDLGARRTPPISDRVTVRGGRRRAYGEHMTRRALDATRPDRRAAGAAAEPLRREGPGGARRGPRPARAIVADPPGPTGAEWPQIVSALRATDEDDLPLCGRLPA
jgi:hypothetical protein